MTVQKLSSLHSDFQMQQLAYHTDIFTKFIWGEMGEDVASITITALPGSFWKLTYIRTQNGEPYFGSGTISNLIDQYEKIFTHEQLYQYLIDRCIMDEFELFITAKLNMQE